MWCVILVAFIAIRAIIDEIIVICMIGAVANVIGSWLYKLGEHFDPPMNNGGGNINLGGSS